MDSRKCNLVILDKIQAWFERERERRKAASLTIDFATDPLRQMIIYIVVISLQLASICTLLI